MNRLANRELEFDILRILAILAVIMIHVSASYIINYQPNSIQFTLANILDSISRIGVPFFVLISGTFMLDENRELTINKLSKKILKLFIILVVWSAFYALVYNFHDFTNAFLYGHYHLWYLYFIIGLYLITPILRKFVRKENINIIYYFIILSLIFSYIPRTLDGLFSHSDSISKFSNLFSMKFVTGLTIYYLTGWLIKFDCIKLQKYKAVFNILGIFSLILIILFTQLRTKTTFCSYNYFYDSSNILVFIYSVALFIACKNYFSKKIQNITDKTRNVLIKLSNLTFGVYLVHASILSLLTSIIKHLSIHSFILEIIILYVGTIILSFIICYIISKIKYLNKLITL